jgi:hypothetical protein
VPTVGTCPVCERPIRVRSGKMVHHGYVRPGRGHIVGDCFAVGRAPYEVSCEATRDYRAVLARRRDTAADFLARLEAGSVETLYADARVPVPTTLPRGAFARKDAGWTSWQSPVHRDETDPRRREVWRSEWTRARQEACSEIRGLDGEGARCDRLIEAWQPGELRDVPRAAPLSKAPRRRRRLLYSRV